MIPGATDSKNCVTCKCTNSKDDEINDNNNEKCGKHLATSFTKITVCLVSLTEDQLI